MSYTDVEFKRAADIIKAIESRVEEAYPHRYSYLDVPLLTELIGIVEKHTDDTDFESVEENEADLRYIAETYAKMGSRDALSAKYYTKMLAYSAILGKAYYADNEEYLEQLREDLHEAIIERNYYSADKCSDIIGIGSELLSESEMAEIYNKAMSDKHLKADSVEASQKFLDIIDEADRYADEHLEYRGRGSCHKLWRFKKDFLAKHGVKWKTPAEMNPDVRFD